MSAAASTAGVIHSTGLTRCFGELTAVHPFDLTVGSGGVTGLLGPNGAGKSTYLRMLLGLVPPNAGTCEVDGASMKRDGVAIRKRVAYSPGELGVYGELTAAQHIEWLLRGRDPAALDRAHSIAAGFNLPLERRVRGFSHGMKRQLFVAAAMAPDVRVRILDEPTEGLDPTRRREVLDLIAEDAERGTTILLSSHHLGEVERVCGRLLFMREGVLLDEGKTRQLHAELQRAVRVAWDQDVDEDRVRATLHMFKRIRIEPRRATVFLDQADPRAAITTIAGIDELPPPTSLTFGELTLQDLYREIYGVEGV